MDRDLECGDLDRDRDKDRDREYERDRDFDLDFDSRRRGPIGREISRRTSGDFDLCN